MKSKQTAYLNSVAGVVFCRKPGNAGPNGAMPIAIPGTSQAALVPCLAAALIVSFGLGCAHAPKQRFKPAWLASQRDVGTYLDLALTNPDADIRRAAVVQVGKTRHHGIPVAMDALALIARSDRSAAVRCAAIRVLARHPGPTAATTMLTLLTPETRKSSTLPAGPGVRRAAMSALSHFSSDSLFEGEAEAAVRKAGIRHLLHDESRDVRIDAAALLAHHPHLDTARALIDALGQSDFAVVFEAERSLRYLTGQSFGYDAGRWRAWLETTSSPFEQGRVMQARQNPPKRPWWRLKRR